LDVAEETEVIVNNNFIINQCSDPTIVLSQETEVMVVMEEEEELEETVELVCPELLVDKVNVVTLAAK